MGTKKSWKGGFFSALSLLTRIPVKKEYVFNPKPFGFYLPLIGLLVAVIDTGLFAGLSRIIPDPFIPVIIALIVQYFIFNLLHFDGLLDSADALLAFGDREKRLAILKDTRIGVFAFFTGGVYLAAKLYLLTKCALHFYIMEASFPARLSFIFLFFSFAVTGRASAALIPVLLKPARKEGLGASLAGYGKGLVPAGMVLWKLLPAGFFILMNTRTPFTSWLYLISFAGCIPGALIPVFLYSRKIGGFTGDTAGAAVELGEIFHIIIFYLFLLYGLR